MFHVKLLQEIVQRQSSKNRFHSCVAHSGRTAKTSEFSTFRPFPESRSLKSMHSRKSLIWK